MSGKTELYMFIAFAAIATTGLIYGMLNGAPHGMAYHGGPWQDMPLDPTQIMSPDASPNPDMTPPQDNPGLYKMGVQGSVSECQSHCFGTAPGEPRVGEQAPLGGAELRDCLSNCQEGIPDEQTTIQECYTCSCPAESITADDGEQATVVCKRVCGADATIVKFVNGPCKY